MQDGHPSLTLRNGFAFNIKALFYAFLWNLVAVYIYQFWQFFAVVSLIAFLPMALNCWWIYEDLDTKIKFSNNLIPLIILDFFLVIFAIANVGFFFYFGIDIVGLPRGEDSYDRSYYQGMGYFFTGLFFMI